MKHLLIFAAVCAALLAGCETVGDNQRTAIGAGTGAVLGGVSGQADRW